MKSMSISVILDWIPDKYRIFYIFENLSHNSEFQ